MPKAQPISPSTTIVPTPMPPAREVVRPRRSSIRLLVGSSSRRMIALTPSPDLVDCYQLKFAFNIIMKTNTTLELTARPDHACSKVSATGLPGSRSD